MTRVGLSEGPVPARPTSHNWRCSCSYLSLLTWSSRPDHGGRSSQITKRGLINKAVPIQGSTSSIQMQEWVTALLEPLPLDLAHFLGGNVADEWNDAPHPQFPLLPDPQIIHMTMASHTIPPTPQEPNQKPQSSPQLPFGAKCQPRGMPDLVDQVDDWIQVQMRWAGRHLWWWKELWAIHMGFLLDDLYNAYTLQFAWWLAAAFRLPLAQVKASGW